MAKDPLAGLLAIGPEPGESKEKEASESASESSDEGELAAAEAAISAINDGDSQAFLDAIKMIIGS